MERSLKNIDIASTIVENYDTESIVVFLSQKLQRYNSGEGKDEELAIYIDILRKLAEKLTANITDSSKISVML